MANVVDTAVAAGTFGTLVKAIQAANMVDTLSGKGPFTVFAPNDEAFNKLPQGTVDSLLKDVPKLKNILSYHVISGTYMAADLTKRSSVETLQGHSLNINTMDGVKINNARVIKADIKTDNGVIHIIDTVLIPEK